MNVSERDRQILSLIDCGADTAVIAEELNMNPWTLRDKIKKLRRRFDAPTMLELPARAKQQGVVLAACDDEWVDVDDVSDEPEPDDDDGRITVDGRPLRL